MHGTIKIPILDRPMMEVRSATFDEATYQIDVVFTTGAIVRRRNFMDGDFDEELVTRPARAVRLERLNAGAPLLDSHMHFSVENVLGSVVPGTARVRNGEGSARIQLTRAASKADIVQMIRDEAIRSISVGYKVHTMERRERRNDVPLHRAVDWEPWELSVVPIPFDPGAHIRGAKPEENELFECRVLADRETVLARMRARHACRGLAV